MSPYYILALFTVAKAMLKQCAHISIVECCTPRMMVVGYNGIIFQDVGLVTQGLRNSRLTSVTYKVWGTTKGPSL